MQVTLSRIKSRRAEAGVALLEASLGVAGLVLLAFILMILSIRAVQAQHWTVMQTLSDSYMSREVALGRRVQFSELTSETGPWPAAPNKSSDEVSIGVLPNGKSVKAIRWRTRLADSKNLAAAGGTGNSESNPVKLETWKLQSYLIYRIGERSYVKTRTIVRTR
ncbi:MAG: hypothetical protein ACI8UO_004257 [Verrucomicrobiales bacterium]|jgi:hypothetical protein